MMLSQRHKKLLHDIAQQSIEHGLQHGTELTVDAGQFDPELQAKRATFVTLHINNNLRGCIGILEPIRPLVQDIAHHAWAAAFRDNRFSPLQQHELNGLDIHISILGTPETITFSSEQDLLDQINAGTDGLILEENNHKSTFLPSVWQSLPDKKDFIEHLKQKAGLEKKYWSNSIKFKRYTVEEF